MYSLVFRGQRELELKREHPTGLIAVANVTFLPLTTVAVISPTKPSHLNSNALADILQYFVLELDGQGGECGFRLDMGLLRGYYCCYSYECFTILFHRQELKTEAGAD